jgi:molecular chaperone GrpE (heat shock protein)
MQSLAHIQETELADNGLYEVVEGESTGELDETVRLKEELDTLRLIRQRFSDVLHSNGVTPFDSEGKPFDPTVHEAMAVIDSDGDESGSVYAEHRRGYFINGELLRPAHVAVLK